MKRLFALLTVVAVLAALLCACGENSSSAEVTTSVKSEYKDDLATQFADKITTDDNGNTVYEFSDEQYKRYTDQHNNTLSAQLTKIVAKNHPNGFGEFVYMDEEKKAVLIGTHKDLYDEKIAQEEAPEIAEFGFKFFQNLKTPVDTIRVVYIEANDPTHNTEYGSFEFSANK